MKKFEKLSREEMKNVKGGTSGRCYTGNTCAFYLPGGILDNGRCITLNGGCICQDEWGNTGTDPACSAPQ